MSRNGLLLSTVGLLSLLAACGCSSGASANDDGPASGFGGSAATASGVGGGFASASNGFGGASTATTTTATTLGVAGSGTVSSASSAGLTSGTSTTVGGGGTAATTCSTVSGEEFFLRPTECAYCHGADALGVAGRGPEVRHPPEDYARWIVRNGRMDHPSFPDGMIPYDTCFVSDTMLEEIIAFLNSFAQPSDGAGLFSDYCANCHGADGRGGVTTRDLNGEVHNVSTIAAQGHSPTQFASRRDFMPVMTGKLTGQELDSITQYLQNDLGLAF